MQHDLTCPPTISANTFDVFAHRCEELGLSAWRYDQTGSITHASKPAGLVGVWLSSPVLRQHVERIAHAWLQSPSPEVAQLFAGCWLVPLIDPEPTKTDQITVVLALGQPALEQEWFEVICASTALDVTDCRRVIGPRAHYQRSDLDHLTKMLSWIEHDLIQIDLGQRAIDEFSEKLIQSYEETNLLFRLARYLNRISTPSQMMAAACGQIQEILPFGWMAIQFNRSNVIADDLAGELFLAGDLPCDRHAFHKNIEQQLTDLRADSWTRLLQPGDHPLAAMVGSEIVVEPITHDDTVVGSLIAGNKSESDPEVSSVETQFLDATADFLSVFHQNVSRFAEQRLMFMGTLGAMTASVDAKDKYTRGHSDRVALLGHQMALAMGMDTSQAERVRISGIVHDVGKIGVPEAVLCKRGRLTAEEFEQIKKHPAIGYNILKDIPPMKDVLPGVLYHHERWDGKGYPHGLSTQNIPLYGRILALADTFDAMSSDRSYRAALPRDRVFDEILRCAETQFDPELAHLFVTLDMSSYDELITRHSAKMIVEDKGQ